MFVLENLINATQIQAQATNSLVNYAQVLYSQTGVPPIMMIIIGLFMLMFLKDVAKGLVAAAGIALIIIGALIIFYGA